MIAFVRTLTPADIPAAMRIKEAAGWNQTEIDWHNLLRLAPETCFGVECGGILAATVTAVCYQRRLAWIGMVLTDPAHRRRGFARRLMAYAIEALTALRMEWIKLDATEMGAPLYRQLGFEPECGIERWLYPFRGQGHPKRVQGSTARRAFSWACRSSRTRRACASSRSRAAARSVGTGGT